jgi:hypothetical protein
MKNYRLDRTEFKIKECIEHLEFLKKSFEFDKSISKFFEERNAQKPTHIFDDVIHFHLLFVIAELEINLCLKSYYNCKSSIEKKYCLKSGFLIIYEFFQSLYSNQNTINNLCKDNEEIKKSYDEITRKLRSFKKEIKLDSKIKEIRDKTGGHFHKNLKEYLTIITSINEENDVTTLYELGLILHYFNNFLLKLIFNREKIEGESI